MNIIGLAAPARIVTKIRTPVPGVLSVWIVSVAIFGCQRDSRYHASKWDHYASGGMFIGAAPSMSPNGSTIVYASPKSGHGDLYLVSRDGSKNVRLTNGPDYEGDPQYSPHGSTIVFVRESQGVGHIWIMNADGSGRKQLTHGAADDNSPSFSPDGSQLVFTRYVRSLRFQGHTSASGEIYVINTDGTEETRLTRNDYLDWPASFSPTGDRIVFGRSRGSQGEIWLMDKNGSNARRIGSGWSPSCSPDGRHIVFLDDRVRRFQYDLYITDLRGDNVRRITSTGGYKSYPTFCLDGHAVLFLDAPHGRGTGTFVLLDLGDLKTERVTTTE